jgi:hypothetical protein
VVLLPAADGGWSCAQWGTHTPPFELAPDEVAAESISDPMG